MPTDSPAVVDARLRRRDRAFAGVIKRHGPAPAHRAQPVAQRFGTLARAILYQQLHGAAAEAIHGRVLAACGSPLTALGLLEAGDETLSACGVSGPKRRSLFDLAAKTLDGTIDLRSLGRRTDDEVTEILTTVRGIGPWTAQMFCLVNLGRRDVWPTGDYGVRAGWTLLHGGGELVAPRELHDLGERFRPHRSTVAWYCWRAVEEQRPSKATA
jgi:3-methyladenine DNA glycosylase/8-oxoguanine DNA glycosylase